MRPGRAERHNNPPWALRDPLTRTILPGRYLTAKKARSARRIQERNYGRRGLQVIKLQMQFNG